MLVFCFFLYGKHFKGKEIKKQWNYFSHLLCFSFFCTIDGPTNQGHLAWNLLKATTKTERTPNEWIINKELMIVTKCAFPFCPDYWLRGKSMWATWVIWPECHLNKARSCPITVTFDTWRIERTALPTNLILGSVSTATGYWGFQRLCHGKKGRDAPSFWKN